MILKLLFFQLYTGQRELYLTQIKLRGSFLIEYKEKKLFFACDTGIGKIYKELEKYGPIDLRL